MAESGAKPVRISAHRHGNDPQMLREAETAGVDYVEIDLHWFRRRLEVRHSKTVGPLPIYWDRGQRARWKATVPTANEILGHADPATAFHLDLKGFNPRLARTAAALMSGRQRLVVSSRSWWLLRPFTGLDAALVLRSIGAPWQRRLFDLLPRRPTVGGVAIKNELLDRDTAIRWTAEGLAVFVWRVHTVEEARRLASWGVDALIVDSLDLARALQSDGVLSDRSPG